MSQSTCSNPAYTNITDNSSLLSTEDRVANPLSSGRIHPTVKEQEKSIEVGASGSETQSSPVLLCLLYCKEHSLYVALLLTLANNSLPIPPIKVSPLNDMMFGIYPVHSMSCIVNGQSIGPEEVCIRNDAPIRAIHVGILNAGSVAPVSPVDSAGGGRERQARKFMSHILHPASLPIRAKQYQSCDLEHETGS